MRSSGSRVDWKIFFVIFTKLIPRKIFFCIAKILVLMVLRIWLAWLYTSDWICWALGSSDMQAVCQRRGCPLGLPCQLHQHKLPSTRPGQSLAECAPAMWQCYSWKPHTSRSCLHARVQHWSKIQWHSSNATHQDTRLGAGLIAYVGRLIFYHYWCWRAGGAAPAKTSTSNNFPRKYQRIPRNC